MELNFKIQGDRLIAGSVLSGNSGNVGTYICNFDILDNTDFVWFCVFKKDNLAYQQLINDNKCAIPKEVLEESGDIQIGCYATNEDIRISTNWLNFSVNDGAYSIATMPDEPTPDVWEELVMNSVPYIGETGNWYVYDIEKKAYVDTGMPSRGEQGEQGETGDSSAKRFPYKPQIDITTEELVRYIDIERINGVSILSQGFSCAKVLLKNSPQSENLSTEFQVKLNKSNVYLSTPTSFLYNANQKYWEGHFDLPNCIALGQSNYVDNQTWKSIAMMDASIATYAAINNIGAFRFQSVTHDIPIGTNIKVWLK